MFAIRDDVSTSLSTAERDLILSTAPASTTTTSTTRHAASSLVRIDGRGPYDRRPVQLDLVRGDNRAVATVKLGAGTRVTATLTGELGPPISEQRPQEGSVAITVDLSPVASTAFRHATPATTTGGSASSSGPQQQQAADRHQKLTANRLLRCLERCLLNNSGSGGGGALDMEALCVVPGRFVWKLNLRVTVLDAAGNLTDATVLACLAAVRHYRKPCTEQNNTTTADNTNNATEFDVPRLVPANFKEPTPLPLHHTPLTITLALFASPDEHENDGTNGETNKTSTTTTTALLVDPTHREELCQSGQVTLALNAHRELCWLDFSGGCEIAVADLRRCYQHAVAHAVPLAQSLEQTLQAAEEQAQQQRLAAALLLQQQKQQKVPPLPDSDQTIVPPLPNVPFWQTVSEQTVETNRTADAEAAAAQDEVYRQRALDYNVGHVATQVRENDPNARAPPPPPNSLLTALLQSVQQHQQPSPGQPTTTTRTSEASSSQIPVATATLKVDSVPTLKSNAAASTPAVATTTTTTPRMDASPAARTTLDEDEEEEVTMQLQSEFQTIVGTAGVAPATVLGTNKDIEDDDVDDLAAAIKNKSSKKKKKR